SAAVTSSQLTPVCSAKLDAVDNRSLVWKKDSLVKSSFKCGYEIVAPDLVVAPVASLMDRSPVVPSISSVIAAVPVMAVIHCAFFKSCVLVSHKLTKEGFPSLKRSMIGPPVAVQMKRPCMLLS